MSYNACHNFYMIDGSMPTHILREMQNIHRINIPAI
jgi:hypothetical protein